jgi:hypothetical protein
MTKVGFIYMVACHDHVKIGYATSMRDRLSTMQVGNPYPIRHLNTFKTDDMEGTERRLHDRFWAYRARGEWFKMPSRLIARLAALETIDGLRVERRCQL